jgi:hypothetical protein
LLVAGYPKVARQQVSVRRNRLLFTRFRCVLQAWSDQAATSLSARLDTGINTAWHRCPGFPAGVSSDQLHVYVPSRHLFPSRVLQVSSRNRSTQQATNDTRIIAISLTDHDHVLSTKRLTGIIVINSLHLQQQQRQNKVF